MKISYFFLLLVLCGFNAVSCVTIGNAHLAEQPDHANPTTRHIPNWMTSTATRMIFNNEIKAQCQCCYEEDEPDKFASCTMGDHSICHGCLGNYVKNVVSRELSVDDQGRIPCFSPDGAGCCGEIHRRDLDKLLPPDLMRQFDQRISDNNLAKSGLQVLRCSQCANVYYFDDEDVRRYKQAAQDRANQQLRQGRFGSVHQISQRTMQIFKCYGIPLFTLAAHGCGIDEKIMYLAGTSMGILEYFHQCVFPSDDEPGDEPEISKYLDKFECHECQSVTCTKCQRKIEGAVCFCSRQKTQYRLHMERTIDALTSRRCPGCKIPIDKVDGCNHMQCSRCKKQFNWRPRQVNVAAETAHQMWRKKYPNDPMSQYVKFEDTIWASYNRF